MTIFGAFQRWSERRVQKEGDHHHREQWTVPHVDHHHHHDHPIRSSFSIPSMMLLPPVHNPLDVMRMGIYTHDSNEFHHEQPKENREHF